MTSSILEAVHETVRGLAKAGVMDTVTLREFDALCLPPIRAIRLRSKASQAVFAPYLNNSASTIQCRGRPETGLNPAT